MFVWLCSLIFSVFQMKLFQIIFWLTDFDSAICVLSTKQFAQLVVTAESADVRQSRGVHANGKLQFPLASYF